MPHLFRQPYAISNKSRHSNSGVPKTSEKCPRNQRSPSLDNSERTPLVGMAADSSHDTNMSSNCAANNENAIYGSLIRIGFEIVNIKNTKFQGTNHKTCGIHALTTRKKFAHQFVLSFLQTLHAKGHATQCRNLLFCIS